FQESIVDEQESNKDENIHLRRFLRVLANLLIICCLCGSGYLIYFVVKRSQTFSKMQNVGWYERNEVRTGNSSSCCVFFCCCWFWLAEEDVVKNITHWTLLGHHNSSLRNGSTATPPPLDPADVPRGPCWETTVGI
ncbi:TMC2 protein, partial [Semnornis frantzii]|nr:TMC2 protein [Semnornis frantzii]